MADSIRELIIKAAKAAITTAVAPVAVYRSRSAALVGSQLPAVVVYPVRDRSENRENSFQWTPWDLMLAVDVVVAADPPDAAADPLVQKVHVAMLAGQMTLGVAGVTDVTPIDTEFLVESAGDVTGITRLMFGVRYRVQQADLASPRV